MRSWVREGEGGGGTGRTAPLKNRKIMMLAVFFDSAQPIWNLQTTQKIASVSVQSHSVTGSVGLTHIQ